MQTRSCLTDQELTALACGRLQHAQLESACDHVDSCESCQERFTRIEATAMADEPLVRSLGKLKEHSRNDSTRIVERLLQARQQTRATSRSKEAAPEVIGPYAIIREIATGGMGTVYEGRHTNLGRSVAIKLLGCDRDITRAQAQQILIEWRANGRLAHPNIVSATDAGLTDNRPYLVTELVDGFDLSVLVRCIGPLHVADAATVAHFVAKGLEHAHRQGIAHLDIKPSNVMIDSAGTVKVLDLGTARLVDLDFDHALNSSDEFGTLAYLAPERLSDFDDMSDRHAPSQPLESDLYSLGCTLVFLLSGRPPFGHLSASDSASIRELVRAHRHDTPDRIQFRDDEPADAAQRAAIQLLIDKLVAKSPADRPAGMSAVVEATHSFVADSDLATVVQRGAEARPRPAEAASGRTLELSDLLSSLESKPTSGLTRNRVATLVALVLAMCAASVWLVPKLWQRSHDAPDPARTAIGGQNSSRPEEDSVDIKIWSWQPDTRSGWLFRSPDLLERARQWDSSAQSAAYESLVPRTQPTQAEWSGDASRLAVLCANGSLRIYRWSGRELHLEHLFNHAGPNILRFAWHPTRQVLAVACRQHVAVLDLQTSPVWSPGRIERSSIKELAWIAASDHDLIITADSNGLSGWDPNSDSDQLLVADAEVRGLAVAHSGEMVAIVHDDQLSVLRAARSIDTWSMSFERTTPLQSPESLVDICWNQNDTAILVRKQRAAEVRDPSSLSILGSLPVPQAESTCLRFVTEAEQPQEAEVTAEGASIRFLDGRGFSANRVTYRLSNRGVSRTGERLQSEIRGAQLYEPLLVPHPHQPILAVVCMGQLQVWDNDFATVYRAPALSFTAELQSLQLRSAVAIFQADGRTLLIDQQGTPACEPIPPVHISKADTYFVRHHAIVEPTMELVQSTTLPKATDSNRSLRQFGLQEQDIDGTTWVIVPPVDIANMDAKQRPYRWHNLRIHRPNDTAGDEGTTSDQSIHSFERRLMTYDPESDSYVVGLDNGGVFRIADDKIRWGTVLPELGENRFLLLDRGGRRLFAAGYGTSGMRLAAFNAEDHAEQWRVEDPDLRGGIELSLLGDELVVAAHASWQIFDKGNGKLLRQFDPYEQYSISNMRIAAGRNNQTLYSCNFFGSLQPACHWSDDLKLQWWALSTGPQHWIILDAAGRELASVGEEMEFAERLVVRRAPSATRWITNRYREPHHSLRILATHADGRVSLHPL